MWWRGCASVQSSTARAARRRAVRRRRISGSAMSALTAPTVCLSPMPGPVTWGRTTSCGAPPTAPSTRHSVPRVTSKPLMAATTRMTNSPACALFPAAAIIVIGQENHDCAGRITRQGDRRGRSRQHHRRGGQRAPAGPAGQKPEGCIAAARPAYWPPPLRTLAASVSTRPTVVNTRAGADSRRSAFSVMSTELACW